MTEPRWHISQYSGGELVSHQVVAEYGYALFQIYRKGLLNGVNVLTRPSQCECRGRLS